MNSPIIISLDVDNLLFDKLQQISEIGLRCVEINSSDPHILKKSTKITSTSTNWCRQYFNHNRT